MGSKGPKWWEFFYLYNQLLNVHPRTYNMYIFEKGRFSGHLGPFLPFFDQNGAKRTQMATKNWEYREIEFIFGFSTQKLVLNDIWYDILKKLVFGLKNAESDNRETEKKKFLRIFDFFHFIFANWVILRKKVFLKFLGNPDPKFLTFSHF